MSQSRHWWLRSAVRTCQRVVGRTRVAKFARVVTDEVRLDTPNAIDSNGEAGVQAVALGFSSPTILDVGCHFGEWATRLLDQTSHPVTLHCFEPSRFSVQVARNTLRERAQVHELGLSDRVGEATLRIVHEGAGSNSLVDFADRSRDSGLRETVPLSTVDRFCAEHDIAHVNLLKIDAEGHDLTVIRGAHSMLSQGAIDLVQFEYNHRWIDARVFLLDAFELLNAHGYRLAKVVPHGIEVYESWHRELEKFVEANYLAYRPEFQARFRTIPWWGG